MSIYNQLDLQTLWISTVYVPKIFPIIDWETSHFCLFMVLNHEWKACGPIHTSWPIGLLHFVGPHVKRSLAMAVACGWLCAPHIPSAVRSTFSVVLESTAENDSTRREKGSGGRGGQTIMVGKDSKSDRDQMSESGAREGSPSATSRAPSHARHCNWETSPPV